MGFFFSKARPKPRPYIDSSIIGDSESGNYGATLRFIFVGDKDVGKASMIYRITENKALQNKEECVPYESHGDGWEETNNCKVVIVVKKKDPPIRVFIRAAFRTKDYQFRTQSFRNPYRGMDAIVLVYDICDKESFNYLKLLLEEALKYANEGEEKRFLLLGNKSDLSDKRNVSIEEAESFAKQYEMTFLEVSAMEGVGINKCFQEFAKGVSEHRQRKEDQENK